MSWYLLVTKPRQEIRALENLVKQNYNCFLPMISVEKSRAGRVTIVTEPLFSRYIFINLNSIDDNWSPIRSTLGVTGMVKFGDTFPSLPNEVVEEIKSFANTQEKKLFTTGEEIIIKSGPFKGHSVQFDSMDSESRAMVLLEMCHKIHRISISLKELTN